MRADEVHWIVNSLGELGVEIAGECFFLYKGESLVYESTSHDEDHPILYRRVGKREFGETVCPLKYAMDAKLPMPRPYLVPCPPGIMSPPDPDGHYEWKPIPKTTP